MPADLLTWFPVPIPGDSSVPRLLENENSTCHFCSLQVRLDKEGPSENPLMQNPGGTHQDIRAGPGRSARHVPCEFELSNEPMRDATWANTPHFMSIGDDVLRAEESHLSMSVGNPRDTKAVIDLKTRLFLKLS